MASTLPKLAIFEAITRHDPKSTAVVHYPSGRKFTYAELVHDVADATHELKGKAEGNTLPGQRIAFLVENGYDYVGAHCHTYWPLNNCQLTTIVTLLSIFANQSIAVPLCTTFPNHELRYIIDQSQALMLLSSDKFREKALEVAREDLESKPIVAVEKITEGKKSSEKITLEHVKGDEEGGMMLYTSGTTSRPVCCLPRYPDRG
jgi:malonyl-CoA/methylmalonyl-CoA synthetase